MQKYLRDFFEKYIYLADMKITPSEYAKKAQNMLLAGIAPTVILAIVALLIRTGRLAIPIQDPIGLSQTILIISLFPVLITVIWVFEPVFKASEHMRQVERELPYISALLSIYAAGGKPPHTALQSALNKPDLFPATSRMVKRINKLKTLFVLDDTDAIEAEGRLVTSQLVSDVLFSAAGAERRGGDIYAVLRDKMKSMFMSLKEKYKSLSDQMKTIGDIILIFYGVMPLTLYVMFALFANPQVQIQSYFYSLIVNPLIGIALVYLIDAIYPKSPIKMTKYYKRLLYTLPIGVGVTISSYFVMSLPVITLYTQAYKRAVSIALGLIAMLLPVALKYITESRRLSMIDNALPSFVRDLTEEIKRGLSPSLAISSIAKTRKYNKVLDKIISKVNAAIRGGYTFRQALDAVKKEVSWRANLTFSLLQEAEELGAKAEVFEEITDVTREVTDSIRIAKNSTAPLRIFGLATAGMIIGVTTMLINWILKPISKMASSLELSPTLAIPITLGFKLITERELPAIVDSVLIGSVITMLILGLMTGKMTEGNLAAGFIYAVITLTISILIMVFTLSGLML